ncbi:extracellular solute-binding protein [Kitasatospora sp. NPDC058965]|uniref:sugar ABC transporter substrate-binding protein n=1 Tax=Kitasatospora sp. NPDC058965 TaxID=3346682 RepID=UPI0036B42C99
MMKRQKAAVVLAATGLTLGLAGCGAGGAKPTVAQDANAPLELWIRQAPGSPSAATAQRLADAFTARTGIKMKVVALFDDFETKLQQRAAQRELPDLVINDTAQLGTLVDQGVVREVAQKDVKGAGTINSRAWQAAQGIDGKYYGVPFSAQSFALLIRKDWRTKVGAEQPRTWDDLVALAQKFTDDDPDGDGKADTYGFNIPGTTTRGYLSWFYNSFALANGVSYLQDTGHRTYEQGVSGPVSVATAAWFQDLFCKTKVVQPGAATSDTTTAHQSFESGKAGIYLTGPYTLSRFDKSLGRDKYEVVALPAGPAGSGGVLAEGENTYLMAGSRNQAGQRAFAEFAASPEGQTIGMAPGADGAIVRLPVNTAVNGGEVRKDPRWDVFQNAYDKNSSYVPTVKAWTPFRQTSADVLNAMVSDCSLTPQDAMKRLGGQLTDELRKQGIAP